MSHRKDSQEVSAVCASGEIPDVGKGVGDRF